MDHRLEHDVLTPHTPTLRATVLSRLLSAALAGQYTARSDLLALVATADQVNRLLDIAVRRLDDARPAALVDELLNNKRAVACCVPDSLPATPRSASLGRDRRCHQPR